MKRVTSLILISTLPAFLACGRIDSSDIRTSGVQPVIEAVALGNGKVLVTTELRLGDMYSTNFLDLSEGDQLLIKSGDNEFEMTRNVSLLNQVYYTAELDGDDEDKAVEISFVRAADEDAPSSVFTLPASFTIKAPEPDLAFVGSVDDLEITWDTSGKDDPLHLLISGICIESHTEEIDDDGSHVVPANTLSLQDDATAGCDIRITLQRRRWGTLDPAFDPGGTIRAVVERKVSISFSP